MEVRIYDVRNRQAYMRGKTISLNRQPRATVPSEWRTKGAWRVGLRGGRTVQAMETLRPPRGRGLTLDWVGFSGGARKEAEQCLVCLGRSSPGRESDST